MKPHGKSTSAYQLFSVFKPMWLIFIIIHVIISSPYWTKLGTGFLNPSHPVFMVLNVAVLAVAVAGLFYPHKFRYFLLAVTGLTVIKIDALPTVPNHIILMLIINGTLLIGLLSYWGWNKQLTTKERIGRWFSRVAPFLRVELLLLYFFVVLHKLNYDFFNPDVSCSTVLYYQISETMPYFPQGSWIEWFVIISTLLLEFLIPILLIFRRSRLLGISAALIFHFLLSLHSELFILSFTAEIYALIILFLPADLVREIIKRFQQLSRHFSLRRWAGIFIVSSAGAVFLYAGLLIINHETFSAGQLKNDLLVLFKWIPLIWFLWGLFIIGWTLRLFQGRWWKQYESPRHLFFSMRGFPLWIFILLVIINGFSPYFGYKTATNFAMFSNLKVSGTETNHLFMPIQYQFTNLQQDTVTLFEANHPDLQLFINKEERIPYFKLSTFLYNHREEEITVRFSRGGEGRVISLGEDPPEDWLESSWIARKLLIFRGVPKSGPTPCQW